MEPLERRSFTGDDRTDRVREARPGRDRGDRSRSDARIKEDVCRWLMDDPRLDTSEIDVEVRDGGVILRGTVLGRCKRLAHDIAAGVPGVREVVSLLQVDCLAA
jgi:osmotically-inducible protein OsmY